MLEGAGHAGQGGGVEGGQLWANGHTGYWPAGLTGVVDHQMDYLEAHEHVILQPHYTAVPDFEVANLKPMYFAEPSPVKTI